MQQIEVAIPKFYIAELDITIPKLVIKVKVTDEIDQVVTQTKRKTGSDKIIPIKVNDVPKYIKRKYKYDITEVTAYAWVNRGKKGKKLKSFPNTRPAMTTNEWIDDFVESSVRRIK